MELVATSQPNPSLAIYRPRQPWKTPLYQLLDTHYDHVKWIWDDRFEKIYGRWRGFVDKVWLATCFAAPSASPASIGPPAQKPSSTNPPARTTILSTHILREKHSTSLSLSLESLPRSQSPENTASTTTDSIPRERVLNEIKKNSPYDHPLTEKVLDLPTSLVCPPNSVPLSENDGRTLLDGST